MSNELPPLPQSPEKKEYHAKSDHDLLIILAERFDNIERNLYRMWDSMNSRMGELSAKIEGKVDYKDYIDHRDKSADKFKSIEVRIDTIENTNLVNNTKRDVYFDITKFTLKHWVQLIAVLGVLMAMAKTIFE